MASHKERVTASRTGQKRQTDHLYTHLRKVSAKNRQMKRRSPADQLQQLDDRLGVGIGATRERAKLQAQIDDPHAKLLTELFTEQDKDEALADLKKKIKKGRR